jgi:hypothetical protein
MNFKTMSIDKLTKLKDQLDAALASKVVESRRMLEAQLAKLDGFGAGPKRSVRGGLRGEVAPKSRRTIAIPQTRPKNLGRPRIEAALADRGPQGRQEARILCHRFGCENGYPEGNREE